MCQTGRQEQDNSRKPTLPALLAKTNVLSSGEISGNFPRTASEVTSPAETENTEESPAPAKAKSESSEGDDEEEDSEDEPVADQNVPSSSSSSTTTSKTTNIPSSSSTTTTSSTTSTTTAQPLVTEVSSDSSVTTKKSAGAQVAEVIDRLVAQRKGITPHIVVVAPFRQKRKPLVTQSVRGLPSALHLQDRESSKNHFAETALLAAAQHPELLMKRTSKRSPEESDIERLSTTASSIKEKEEEEVSDKEEEGEEDEEDDDANDSHNKKDSNTEFENSKPAKPNGNVLNSTEAKSSVNPKTSPTGQTQPARRKSAIELRAESLRKLRSKLRRPMPFASRSLNRPYMPNRSSAVAASTSSPVSEHIITVASVNTSTTSTKTSIDLDSSPTRVLNSPIGSSNAAYRSKYFVKKSSNTERSGGLSSANSRPDFSTESLQIAAANPTAQSLKKPALQAFTVREQLYSARQSLSNRQKQATVANGIPQRKTSPPTPVLLNAASLQPTAAINPIQRSMQFGSTNYNAYGHSPTQRMQHSVNSVQQLSKQQQQLMAQHQQLLALGQQEMLATAIGPQITLAQLAQMYPQQYLEFMQQHQQQINQHQQQLASHPQQYQHQSQHQLHQQQKPQQQQIHQHQQIQQQHIQKGSQESAVDSMVAYQQASHQKFSLQPSKANAARPAVSNGNFGEGTAESIGHKQHVHSNKLLAGSDSSNSAMVNFNLDDGPDKGLSIGLGGGPSAGGAQLITSPMGIFKSLLLPLLPRPRMNLNGKVVFGVVLEKGVGFGKPKKPPVMVHVPHKHGFFGK